jgi:peptidoglycan/xylan/chitin deacetylase (PgdA/CDA1 family)
LSRGRILAVLVLAALAAGAAPEVEALTDATAAAHVRLPRTRSLTPADRPAPVPLPPACSPRVATPVPVLMYHAIGNPPADAPFPGLFTPRGAFVAQMRALAGAGYHPVTLDRVWRAWRGRGALPPRPVVLSFDDGYRGDYTIARPVLRQRAWPAVLNLVVANLHRLGWGLRTWMVERMAARGWEVDSHTLTHPDLTTVAPGSLRREVQGSRSILRRLVHQPVEFFAYPYGRFDAAVIEAVRQAGYVGAETTLPGLARPSQAFTLRRVRVEDGEAPADVLASLAG